MKRRITIGLLGLALAFASSGCMTGGEHAAGLHSSREQRLTVGVVQKEIRTGMSQADVAIALGSPNIVTRDVDGTETWIYDKIATEASYSHSSGGISGLLGAGGAPGSRALVLGGVGAGFNASSGAAATSQRTLTVVIKFDKANLVTDFTYHSSRF